MSDELLQSFEDDNKQYRDRLYLELTRKVFLNDMQKDNKYKILFPMLYLYSMNSEDERTYVGAMIIDSNNNPLSFGVNHHLTKQRSKTKTNIIHAEHDAIMNFYKNCNHNIKDTIMLCTHIPCENCSQTIVLAGIPEIVYDNNALHNDINNNSKIGDRIRLLESLGITCTPYNGKMVKEIIKRNDDVSFSI